MIKTLKKRNKLNENVIGYENYFNSYIRHEVGKTQTPIEFLTNPKAQMHPGVLQVGTQLLIIRRSQER